MAVLAEQQVGRLEIPVDDAHLVGMVERLAHVEADDEGLRVRQGPAGVEEAAEASTGEVLGDEIGRTVDSPVVDSEDVGVLEAGNDTGLLGEPFDEHRITGQRLVEDLDGDVSTQVEVFGGVDGTGGAGADRPAERVPPAEDACWGLVRSRPHLSGLRWRSVGHDGEASPYPGRCSLACVG